MAYKYSKKFDKEKMARALGNALPISTKKSIEICSLIRGKSMENAEKMLKDVISQQKPISYKRFTDGAGHKPGLGPGKYPVKTAEEILKILELAKANATAKHMDADSLIICHANAQKAGKRFHYGRVRGKMKITHIEIFVEEAKEKSDKSDKKNKKKNTEAKKEGAQ